MSEKLETLEARLLRQVRAINTTLLKLHDIGQSVMEKGNGYPLQLQEGELLQIEIKINRCSHKWDWRKMQIDPDITWERCWYCGMTRNIEESVLSAEIIGD